MKNIKKTIYFIKREKAKNIITGDLGRVIEDDDKLICYVNRLSHQKDYNGYLVRCDGINNDNIAIAEKYGLNKPICYIFENINFKNKYLTIYGEIPCEVIINKCNVNYLTINIAGTCTLDTLNIIKPLGNLIVVAKDVTLNGVRVRNFYYRKNGVSLDILIKAKDNLDINESYIGKLNENTYIIISAANKMTIRNSIVSADIIKCEATHLEEKGYNEINANDLSLNVNKEDTIHSIYKVLRK